MNETSTAVPSVALQKRPNAVQRMNRAIVRLPLAAVWVADEALGLGKVSVTWSKVDLVDMAIVFFSWLFLPVTLPIALLRWASSPSVRDFLFGPGEL